MANDQGEQVLTPSTARKEGRAPRKMVLVTPGATDAETEKNLAQVVVSPALAAYRVIAGTEAKSELGELIDVPHLMAELRRQADAASRGDLTNPEAMLMNQATALQSLFARLTERAMGHTTIPGLDANMRMALRAQSQCRCTLETLATIKSPPLVYARQANVTTGPQQVNNGVTAARARETEIAPTKLLEAQHGEKRLDIGTAGTAGKTNSDMEAVGAIHGATHGSGEGQVEPEPLPRR